MQRHPADLAAALEQAVAGLQAVLVDTAVHSGAVAAAKERTAAVSRARELRLVQNLGPLAAPVVEHRAEEV